MTASQPLPASQPRSSLTVRAALLIGARIAAFAFSISLPLVLVRRMPLEEFGTYQQAFQIVATLMVLLPMGFGMTAHYFLPREPQSRGLIVKNILLVYAAVGGLAALVFTVAPVTAALMVGNPAVTSLGPLIGLVVFLWILGSFLEVSALANEETFLAPAFVILAQFLKTTLLLGAAVLAGTVRALVLAALIQGLLQVCVLGYYLHSRFPQFWKGFDAALLRRQVTYALPFALSGLLWTLQTDMHAYFVSHGFGEAQFAIYRIACFELPIIGIVAESVNSVMIPRVSRLQMDGRRDEIVALVVQVIRRLSVLFIPLYAVLLVLSREFIVGLFTMKFIESWPLFVINITLIPTAVLSLDSVVRSDPALGHFVFRFRLFVLAVLLGGLTLGTMYFDLRGMIAVVVAVALFERLTVAARVARTLRVTRHDLASLRDLRKIIAATVVGSLATLGVRAVVSVPPLAMLAIGGIVFGVVYAATAMLLHLPTAEERAQLLALVRRVPGGRWATGGRFAN